MLTPQKLGIKTANTLLAELTIPANTKFSDSKLAVCEEVPTDCKFFKHEQDKLTIEPTKEALLQDMLGNQKSIVAFCCTSLQIDTKLAFDIDHVFPREKIIEKQKLLLNYLNAPNNDIFAKAFMGEDPQDEILKQKIGKYFKYDPNNNKIKGTQWFFDVCYNNLSNLFHLKNYLNRGKSATTPKEWFEQNFQPKLPQFMQNMNDKGGINEGVIMQQIFSISISGSDLDSINLGKVKDKKSREVGDDVIVYLHENIGVGLGEFVRHWFKDNANYAIENSREIHEIKDRLTKMLEDDLCDTDNSKKELEKFLLTINEVLNVAIIRDNLSRASSVDSDQAEKERPMVVQSKILEAFDYMHSVKQIKKTVLTIVEDSDKLTVEQDFYKYCREQKLAVLDYEGIKEAMNFLAKQCGELQSRGTLLTSDKVVELLQDARKAADPRVQLAVAKASNEEKDLIIAELQRQLALERQQVVAPQSTSVDLPKSKRPRSSSP